MFAYDAENNDELSFDEGDELLVVERNDRTKLPAISDNEENDDYDPLWWLCEHTKGERIGQRGFVPRNYLSLYPIWRYREKHNFTSIELPSTPLPLTPYQRRRRIMQKAQHEQQTHHDQQFLINVLTR